MFTLNNCNLKHLININIFICLVFENIITFLYLCVVVSLMLCVNQLQNKK